MESLQNLSRRADAHVEDKDGNLAVIMLSKTGDDGAVSWFTFQAGFTTPVLRVEWESGAELAILPAEITNVLIQKGYGRMLLEVEFDALVAENPAPAAAPAAPVAPPAEADQVSGDEVTGTTEATDNAEETTATTEEAAEEAADDGETSDADDSETEEVADDVAEETTQDEAPALESAKPWENK